MLIIYKDFAELGAFWMHILKLESESIVTVLVIVFIAIWQDLYPHALLSFLITKDQLTSALFIMFASLSNMFLVTELNGLVVDSDSSVTTVLSDNFDFALFLGWGDLDALSVLKANLSRLVIVDDNVEGLGVLAVSEFNNAVERFVILVGFGVAIDGACTHDTSLSLFIYNSNSQLSGGLTDRVMQALEAEELVLHILVQLVGVGVLKFHFFVLSNNGSLASHHVVNLLSIFDSADHTLALNNFLELLEADLVNLVRLHCLLEESLHLVSLIDGFLVLWGTALLLNKKILVDLISRVLDDWFVIICFASSFFGFGLLGSESVGSIGKHDEDHEED